MIETVSQWLVELVSDLVGAVLADICGVIDKIASSAAREESIHILATSLAGGSSKGIKLRGGADHWAVVELSYHLYYHQSLLRKGSEAN